MTKLEGIRYVSTSEIKDFNECQFRYFHKHIKAPEIIGSNGEDYVDILPKEYHMVGKYRHKVLEEFMVNQNKSIMSIAIKQLAKYGLSLDRFIESEKLFNQFLKRAYINYKVLKTEQGFYTILGNGVALRGRIDLISEVDKKTLLITDYKTGDFPMNQSTLEKSLQMKNYSIAASIMYPKYKNIICQIDAIKHGVFEKKVTGEWIEGVEDFLEAAYTAMLEKSKTKESDYKPTFNNTCFRCEFKKICPLVKNLDKLKINPLNDISGKTLKYLVEVYLKNYNLWKIAESNAGIAKSILVELFEKTDSNEITEKWGSVSYRGKRIEAKIK